MCEPRFQFKAMKQTTDMDHVLVTNERHCYHYVDESADGRFYKAKRLDCQVFNARLGEFNWRDCGIMEVTGLDESEVVSVQKSSVIAKGIVTKKNIIHIWTRDLHDF